MTRNVNLFVASAVVTLTTLATLAAVPAHAVVPGSDTYERARETAAVQSVIENRTVRPATGFAGETRSYGYPSGRAAGALVPGSDRTSEAADTEALQSVIGSQPQAGARALSGRMVPGSDSF